MFKLWSEASQKCQCKCLLNCKNRETHRATVPFLGAPPTARTHAVVVAAAGASGSIDDLIAPPPPAEWSEQDLARLMEESARSDEAAKEQDWRSSFDNDPSWLFQEGQASIAAFLDRAVLERMREDSDGRPMPPYLAAALTQLDSFLSSPGSPSFLPPTLAADVIGMGMWRLNGAVSPLIEAMVGRIEGMWRELMEDDLRVYPEAEWREKNLDFLDSLDPTSEWAGFAYVDVPDPQPGEEGYPRLLIENRMYCSRVFRKLHMEVAWRQDGMEVLHVVMNPRYEYDVPIFALDVVSFDGNFGLAIVDLCPVRRDLNLPQYYSKLMQELRTSFIPSSASPHNIPPWGKAILSPLCLCLSPGQDEDVLGGFIKYTLALHRGYLSMCARESPVAATSQVQVARLRELQECHQRFVENQRTNLKTLRILEAAFGTETANDYMTNMLFDFTPQHVPDYVDTSITRLYRYFDANPVISDNAKKINELESKNVADKQRGTLGAALISGLRGVSRERLAEALEGMYNADRSFREAIHMLRPDLAQAVEAGGWGTLLAAELEELIRPQDEAAAKPVYKEGGNP